VFLLLTPLQYTVASSLSQEHSLQFFDAMDDATAGSTQAPRACRRSLHRAAATITGYRLTIFGCGAIPIALQEPEGNRGPGGGSYPRAT
jgi:hypothetical protein